MNGMAYIAHDNLGLRPVLCTLLGSSPGGRTDKDDAVLRCDDAPLLPSCLPLDDTPSITHITWNKPRGQVRSGQVVAIRAAPSRGLNPRVRIRLKSPSATFP